MCRILLLAGAIAVTQVTAQPPPATETELRSLRADIQDLRKLVQSLELTIAAGLKRLELLRVAGEAQRLASEKHDLEQSLESVREERSMADPESIPKLNGQESILMGDLAQTNLRLEESTRAAERLQSDIARLERENQKP